MPTPHSGRACYPHGHRSRNLSSGASNKSHYKRRDNTHTHTRGRGTAGAQGKTRALFPRFIDKSSASTLLYKFTGAPQASQGTQQAGKHLQSRQAHAGLLSGHASPLSPCSRLSQCCHPHPGVTIPKKKRLRHVSVRVLLTLTASLASLCPDRRMPGKDTILFSYDQFCLVPPLRPSIPGFSSSASCRED